MTDESIIYSLLRSIYSRVSATQSPKVKCLSNTVDLHFYIHNVCPTFTNRSSALVIHRIFSIFCSLLHTFITSLMTSFCDKISMVYHSIVWHFLYSDHQSIFKRRKKKKNVVVAWGEIRQVCRKIPKGCFASSLLCFPQLHFFSMLT